MMRGVRQGCPASGYLFTMALALFTGGSCQMSCRPNLTERGFCKDVPAPALTTLLSLRPLCANPFQSWQTPLRLLIL